MSYCVCHLVHGVRHLGHGVRHLGHGIRHLMYGIHHLVYGVHHLVHGVHRLMHGVHHPVHGIPMTLYPSSYKEESGDEDLVGSDVNDWYDEDEPLPLVDDNRPVIEKVLESKQGPVGGGCGCIGVCGCIVGNGYFSDCLVTVTGEKSSLAYQVLKKAGQEVGLDEGQEPMDTVAASQETETQFLIKWVGRSHLHNTWETSMCVLCGVLVVSTTLSPPSYRPGTGRDEPKEFKETGQLLETGGD